MDELNQLLANVNVALGEGTDTTEIGQMIGSVQRTLTGVEELPGTLDRTINQIRMEIRPILANIGALTAQLVQPDGLVFTVLDTEREVYTGLVQSLGSLSGILESLDRTVAFIPGQLPQLAALIADVRVTLRTAEDALIAITNNPLLRGGVPERPDNRTTGPRDIRF
jgi:phospholipid/cholesterol/gamma-HCH transport system substrate-binding protein